MTRSRPFGVTVISLLCGIGALLAIYYTLQYLGLLPFYLGQLAFFGFNFWGALMWGLSALAYLWAMRALWVLDPQGWMFATIISGFNLIIAVLSIIGASTFQALLPGLVVNGAILIYCLLPGTKEAFGQA